MADKEKKRKCFKCGCSGEDNKLFRFPKPALRNLVRCELWAKYIFPEKDYSSTALQMKLHREHRMLCEKHFNDADFADVSKKKLLRTATPYDDVKMLSDSLSMQPNHCGTSRAIKCWTWDVNQITMNKVLNNNKYAILILNRPVSQNQEFMKRLWNNAAIRMTIDGGTKQWDRFLSNFSDDMKNTIRIPDLVTGDFDSITDEILEKYDKKGCKIIRTPDQNYTDFTKGLMELNKYSNRFGMKLSHVIAVAQSSGRIDHTLGNIQTLFLVKEKFLLDPNTKVFIMSDNSVSWLLQPGDHVIYVPEEVRQQKRAWCSLVPIGETCQYVTSTGLKWNLDNQPLKFGGIVSTSNSFDGSEKVTIKCSHTLLWSMKLPFILTS